MACRPSSLPPRCTHSTSSLPSSPPPGLSPCKDYAADTGKTRTVGGRELLYARSAVQNYARAFGLQAIDMVCIDYKNPARLADEARVSAASHQGGRRDGL